METRAAEDARHARRDDGLTRGGKALEGVTWSNSTRLFPAARCTVDLTLYPSVSCASSPTLCHPPSFSSRLTFLPHN